MKRWYHKIVWPWWLETEAQVEIEHNQRKIKKGKGAEEGRTEVPKRHVTSKTIRIQFPLPTFYQIFGIWRGRNPTCQQTN